jgi:pimeloyl-ACP methyl ester carboxylesterase
LPTIDAVVDAVGEGRPVTLMLHDWGCAFGYQYCLRHPGKVSRIIGVDIGDPQGYWRALGPSQKAMVFGYQATLALAWLIGGRLGDRMTRAMARAMRCRADPALISARMNYPYFIAWTGAHGSYRGMKPFRPHCPMLFVYGRRKPFMFHTAEWAAWLAAQPGQRGRVISRGSLG